MEWFKQHGDTIATLAVFATCFWNLNEKMNSNFIELKKDIASVQREVAAVEKEVFILKTVMIMKNIMPSELVHHDTREE